MSAIVDVRTGKIRQLDKPAEPDEQVTPEQVQSPERLARLLMTILRFIAALRRLWWPRSITFTNIDSTGTSIAPVTKRLAHNFGTAVNWWVVGCKDPGVVDIPLVISLPETDNNTLVLSFYYPATFAVRVEVAG